ncbi:PREDICTED: uncharacterized protein LOC109590862 [Amphimedon queenslandica]|uniref:G-protein coupled receptors family 2 profile 1 domain-containing protein n=1 Tax=Amphimedon queenslandica TaxID=400682 RepID=A0AAN0JYU1_AMPQE|nr:PREDICTED: uncharacterized protein LOC109590862 [Amphimedon queenslandica]|eukprot:XP_019862281.1 PREDICTED: uncharacterized protein LOC109590862 [Amphimedon queenslandica]
MLRFLWKEYDSACPVTITHGMVQVLNYIVQLNFCSNLQRSTRIVLNQLGRFYSTSGHCLSYVVKTCRLSSNQTICIISEPTSSSPTSNSSAELTPLILTSLPLAASSQLPEPSEIISSLSSSKSLPLSPSLPSIVNSSVSISDSSDFSLPTSMLSSASQLNSFSIQATSSKSTSVLSSASQLNSTSSMHILSSRPHSSNSGLTPLSRTTMPAVTSIVAATSFSHINSPSPSLSLSLMNCPETNQWESTKPGQWANGTCYKGTFNATRYCDLNGSWGRINCSVSKQFIEIMSKINISHYVALKSLSQQLNDFPAAQSIVLLDFIIKNSNMESDNETTQIVLDIASEIIQMASNKMDGISIFSQLLMTLDNFALNVGQDLSLSTDSIFLNVKQIEDFPDEEATAIDYNGNTLTLPNAILNAVPATVASFVYEDLSVLSPTNDDELISPVIPSTVRCNDTCNTNDFNESVTITFNLSDVQQSLNGRNISCVFWKFNNM